MNAHRRPISRRRADRLALGGLRMVLAAAFLVFGLGFLDVPRLAADPRRFDHGPKSWLMLGASHVAIGIALLAPPLRAGTMALVGSLVIWSTVCSLPTDETFPPVRVVDPDAIPPRQAPAIEILLPTGPIVPVPSGFDPRTLGAVLAVLEGRPC